MALKRKINKETFDKLKADVQAEYKLIGEDYVLDTEGDEDTSALKRAKDREKARADKAQAELDEIKEKLADETTLDARKKGDLDTLEKSWKETADKRVKTEADKVKARDAIIERTMIDNVAMQMANKISKAPNLILPHIKARMKLEWDGEEPKARILDKDGKASALTVDELSNEFIANKDFAAIMIASQASGGARSSQTSNGGGAPTVPNFNPGDSGKPADLARATPTSLVAMLDAQKANASN